MPQPHLFHHLRRIKGSAAGALPHAEGFFDRQLAGQTARLQHDAHQRTHFAAVDDGVFPENRDCAGRCTGETFDDFQRCCLASAIGAEQTVDLAAVNVEVEVINCFERGFSCFIRLVQVADLQDFLR